MSLKGSEAPFAATPVLSIAAVVAVAQAAAAVIGYGYWFDEVYMLAIGRHHLDWGSADQPPLAPTVAAVMDAIAPESVFVLRLTAVLATAASVVLAALIARELGGDGRAQALTAGAQATGVWAALAGHWLTPYTLEPVGWLLVVWLLFRWIRVRRDVLLLLLGVVAGVAAMTKFQVLLLGAALLLTVAVFGPRDLLRRPLLWVGIAIGGLIALPSLLWQHAHGWPQLAMARIVAGEADALYGGRPGIAVQLIVFAGVLGVLLGGYGLWRLLRADDMRPYRFVGATFALLLVLFVVTEGRPYYLAGLYAPLAAAGAVGLQRRREAGRTRARWLIWPTCALSAALAVGMLVLGTVLTKTDDGERIAQRTAASFHGLAPDVRERTVVVGESYIIAAYVDGFSTRYDLRAAYSPSRSYGYFPEPAEEKDAALFIGADPDELRPYFGHVRKIGDVTSDLGAFLLTDRRQPWSVIWPRVRNLTVS